MYVLVIGAHFRLGYQGRFGYDNHFEGPSLLVIYVYIFP